MKKKLVIGLSIAGIAALAIGNSLAYLSDKQTDLNVMTMGNVKIEQLEYERVVDENGSWVSTGEVDKYGYTPDTIQEFSQAKPLYPAVFAEGNIKWDDRNGSENASGEGSHQQSWGQIEAPGSLQLFDDSVKNVQDKFVFVKNTGLSDAYVRTWVALEQGDIPAERFSNIIMTNSDASEKGINEAGGNSHWIYNVYDTDVEIDGNKYVVFYYTYVGAKGNNGVLKPGDISYPNLAQIYMKPEATNEDVEDIDGNGNGYYDILVLSQAVQTKGFDSAETALNSAFGTTHPWGETKMSVPSVENGVMSLSGDIYLIDEPFYSNVSNTEEVTINGNGHNVHQIVTTEDKFSWDKAANQDGMYGTVPNVGNIFSSANGAKITINDLSFSGTTNSIALGNYRDYKTAGAAATYNFNTELNNVDVIGLEVYSYSSNVSPAIAVYGTAKFNKSNVYNTKLSALDTELQWTVYDLALVNYSNVTLNDSQIGSIYMWKQANITVDEGSIVESITVPEGMKKERIVVKNGGSVNSIIVDGIEMTYEEWLNS